MKLEKFTLMKIQKKIGNVNITIKGLEAYLEAAFQLQLQLHVYYHGFELGWYYHIHFLVLND